MGKRQEDVTLEHKWVPFAVASFDPEGRTFEGYAAVFGNVDIVDDIIHPGAFSKTLQERGPQIRVLWSHDSSEPIGKPVEMREDTNGLYVKAMISDTRRGRDALALLKDGAVDGLSIGYDPIETDFSAKDNGDGEIRNLREVRLWEFSLVAFPANEAARVLGLKEIKAVIGATDLPLGERDRSWDAGAARGRLKAWAGGDEPNAKYAKAFFQVDGENRDNYGAYKLPFADVIEGDLVAVPGAIFAVAAALQGARGGVDIPDSDVGGIKTKVEGYYAKMRTKFDDDSIVVPWKKSVEPAEDAEGNVVQVTNYNLELKALTDKERAAVQAAIGALQRVLSLGQEEEEGEGKQQDSPAGAEPSVLDSLTHSRKLAELRRLELEVLEG